jgi:glutaredoxin 3
MNDSADTVADAPNGVVMYSTAWCGFCERARALLDRKGIAVTEIKVDENIADRETMLKRSGGRRTVPQIFIRDRHIGGYHELSQLDRSGELDRLLQG